jgi:hypothetical protein
MSWSKSFESRLEFENHARRNDDRESLDDAQKPQYDAAVATVEFLLSTMVVGTADDDVRVSLSGHAADGSGPKKGDQVSVYVSCK